MTSATATQALSVPAAIEARRSIRKYKPGPVPPADLDEILRLTSLAPSSANTQPWRFVVIQDPALQATLQGHAYNQAQVGSAPALIVLYSDLQDSLSIVDDLIHPGVPADRRPGNRQMLENLLGGQDEAAGRLYGGIQTGIALGYLTLAAQSLGYATSVMGGFDAEKFRVLLGLPAHAHLTAVVALGVADEPGFSTHRLPVDRLVRRIG